MNLAPRPEPCPRDLFHRAKTPGCLERERHQAPRMWTSPRPSSLPPTAGWPWPSRKDLGHRAPRGREARTTRESTSASNQPTSRWPRWRCSNGPSWFGRQENSRATTHRPTTPPTWPPSRPMAIAPQAWVVARTGLSSGGLRMRHATRTLRQNHGLRWPSNGPAPRARPIAQKAFWPRRWSTKFCGEKGPRLLPPTVGDPKQPPASQDGTSDRQAVPNHIRHTADVPHPPRHVAWVGPNHVHSMALQSNH